jgi:hypothetical protein
MVEIQKKIVKAGKFVDTEHVEAAIRNYKKERWVHNSQRLGKEDSLSVWYSVEELEEFLGKCKEHGADGIRMYFGAYDVEHAPKKEYEGRQTILLVASKERDTLGGASSKDVYIPTETGTSILAFNVGRLCPPMCPTGYPPKTIGTTIIDKGKDGMIVA